MPATATDRLNGLQTSVAIKPPCRVATTVAITLSGLQTVDGQLLVADDRVLVKDQADTTANGIYEANASRWTRAPDFDGARDAVSGTLVIVRSGSANGDTIWELTTANPVVIGTNALTFEKAVLANSDTAAFIQAGTGAVTRTAQDKMRDVVGVKDFGAVGDGSTNDTVSIQAAIDAVNTAGGGTVNFPVGTYMVDTLTLKSNVHLSGHGKQSLLKVRTVGANNILVATSGDLSNVVIDALGFDGSLNYPAGSTTYKQTYALANTAVKLYPATLSNVKIKNCWFNQLSNQSIDIQVDGGADVEISGNYFYKGSYKSCVILCRIANATATSTTRLRRYLITRNYIDTNGPQVWHDAGKDDYCASCDGIQIDKGQHCLVSDNIIKNAGGIGVRIEESLHVSVVGNMIVAPAADGIAYYKVCFGGSITGNTIISWGRVPNATAIRTYGGVYVAAKEFPKAAGPTLPADPTASSWFQTWPFDTSVIDVSTIQAYSTSAYYTTGPTGILPFRGYSAISVIQDSEALTITGNTGLGDTTQVGGKYTHSSDFGVGFAHSVNDSQALTPQVNGRNCVVQGNTFSDVRVARIYHPRYQDPLNLKGELGFASYFGNYDSSSTISVPKVHISDAGVARFNQVQFPAVQVTSSDPNTLDDYEEGTFGATINVGSGSITQQFSTLAYTKVGRLVTITGEVNMTAVAAPSGAVTLTTLPFANSGLAGRSSLAAFYVFSSSLTGVTTGHVVGALSSNSTTVTLSFYEAGIYSDLGAKFQANSALRFSFSYHAAA